MTGILKMFLMNFGEDHIKVISRLNIIPVSISYEYDPCDYLKALELYHAQKGLPFKKDKEFNMNSMLTGVQGNKGRVHISFGRPVSDMLKNDLEKAHPNDLVKWLADQIDQEIHMNYRLWPANYIACDLMNDAKIDSGKYTDAEKSHFLNRLEERLKNSGDRKADLMQLILTQYANSVTNQAVALQNNTRQ
jgi:hypothetical protein